MKVDYKDIQNAPQQTVIQAVAIPNDGVVGHELNSINLFVITDNPQWAAKPLNVNELKLTGPTDELFTGKILIHKL